MFLKVFVEGLCLHTWAWTNAVLWANFASFNNEHEREYIEWVWAWAWVRVFVWLEYKDQHRSHELLNQSKAFVMCARLQFSSIFQMCKVSIYGMKCTNTVGSLWTKKMRTKGTLRTYYILHFAYRCLCTFFPVTLNLYRWILRCEQSKCFGWCSSSFAHIK